MEVLGTLTGDRGGSLDLLWGTDECPPTAPTVVGAEPGLSCFDASISSAPKTEADPILRLAKAMRGSADGMWLALVDGDARRCGLVQSDYSAFYKDHHESYHRGRAWRDFYYRAVYVLLDQIDRRWKTADIELRHPTGYEWRPDLAPTVVEALFNLVDARVLDLKRVHVHPCSLDGPHAIQEAVRIIEQEQADPHRAAPRPIAVEERDPDELGYKGPAEVSLLRVDVLSRSDDERALA